MHHQNVQRLRSKAFLLFLCSFVFFTTAIAQKIQGFVHDTEGKPAANATVLLLKATDSTLVKGSVTNKEGVYIFQNIGPGSYLIASSAVGFKVIHSAAFDYTFGEDKDVAVLKFKDKEVELSNVTITAKKPLYEQKMDRMIINVASSVTAAGSTALDVLERSPGIIVDRQNNSLSMNGKDGVVVMINGKISRMPITAVVQMLAGMNSSNVEKIELITTPPSNFEAEGNAGYINIVLKVNNQYGTNGSYSATAGYGKGVVAATSINFNHRAGKTNVFGDYSVNRNAQRQKFYFYRRLLQQGQVLESEINSDRDPMTVTNNLRLGMDYQLNKKTVVGGLVSGFYRNWDMLATNRSDIFLSQRLDTVVHISNDELHDLYNYSANLNLLHNFKADERISIDVDYIYYKDYNPVDYVNSYFNGAGGLLYEQQTRSGKNTPIRFWVSNADYTRKLGKKIDMESGIKGSFSNFINDVEVENLFGTNWVKDKEFTTKYDLQESILAAYTSLGITLTEKSSVKVGLRYEYTSSLLNSETQKGVVDREYGNLFPTAFFSHKINDKHSFNLAYNRRITRPTFNDMAPFVIFVDPNTLFSGNPALQPSISNGVKADYLFKRFIFSVSYTLQDDPITNFSPKVDPVTNKQTLAAENQKESKTFSALLSLPFTVAKWWNMQNNLMGNKQELKGYYKGDPITVKQGGLMARTTQSFTLPKDFTFELSGFYRSAGLFGIYKMKPFGVLDAGLQKKFTKINSSLKLAYDNLLNTLKFKSTIDLPDQNLLLNARLQFRYPTLRLTYTHNFGNTAIKGARNRSNRAEERERVESN